MIGDWIDKVEYPQLPSMSNEELLSFLEKAQFARLGTLNEDGTIHIAPIFFKYDEGCLLMASQDPSRKVRNIKRNNNVTSLTQLLFLGKERQLTPAPDDSGFAASILHGREA